MKPHVLIAEDESAVCELLSYNLEREGYAVSVANDGEEALLIIEENTPDLILLDWMLPKVPGIEVCRRVRARAATKNLPIIMLTARAEETDRIRGLDTGADDYITKPFSTTELMARIRAVFLGPLEYRLLDHFMQHPGRVFSREQLLDAVWGTGVHVELRTVDVHVGRLRKVLKSVGEDPIRTVRSAGYAMKG